MEVQSVLNNEKSKLYISYCLIIFNINIYKFVINNIILFLDILLYNYIKEIIFFKNYIYNSQL